MTELTQQRLKELLSYDHETGLFTWRVSKGTAKKGSIAGYKHLDGYIQIMIDNKNYLAHRLAWIYVYGSLPEKDLDHINEIKDNNRICNLRLATRQENNHNISKPRIHNISGFRGVCWCKCAKKWKSQIGINGKKKYLGIFNTAEEAYEAYLKAKREIHPFWVEDKVA
jgi:hypothetical protein